MSARTKQRESAAERDERIVREAGPWKYEYAHGDWGYVASVRGDADDLDEETQIRISCAAARVLNRLSRKGRR